MVRVRVRVRVRWSVDRALLRAVVRVRVRVRVRVKRSGLTPEHHNKPLLQEHQPPKAGSSDRT